jgi:hypothetical protein
MKIGARAGTDNELVVVSRDPLGKRRSPLLSLYSDLRRRRGGLRLWWCSLRLHSAVGGGEDRAAVRSAPISTCSACNATGGRDASRLATIRPCHDAKRP